MQVDRIMQRVASMTPGFVYGRDVRGFPDPYQAAEYLFDRMPYGAVDAVVSFQEARGGNFT